LPVAYYGPSIYGLRALESGLDVLKHYGFRVIRRRARVIRRRARVIAAAAGRRPQATHAKAKSNDEWFRRALATAELEERHQAIADAGWSVELPCGAKSFGPTDLG